MDATLEKSRHEVAFGFCLDLTDQHASAKRLGVKFLNKPSCNVVLSLRVAYNLQKLHETCAFIISDEIGLASNFTGAGWVACLPFRLVSDKLNTNG